uniref:Uncharacterized protein n=1 Tax=Pyrodinium bahamense TaxID=73915 RepID=A0A7S0FFR1_9DINO
MGNASHPGPVLRSCSASQVSHGGVAAATTSAADGKGATESCVQAEVHSPDSPGGRGHGRRVPPLDLTKVRKQGAPCKAGQVGCCNGPLAIAAQRAGGVLCGGHPCIRCGQQLPCGQTCSRECRPNAALRFDAQRMEESTDDREFGDETDSLPSTPRLPPAARLRHSFG